MVTTASLTLGLASIMTSIQLVSLMATSQGELSFFLFDKFWWAAAFIAISIVLDMLDGRLARALGSDSSFGLSYDSLSDVVSFGVAPAVLVYVWVLKDAGRLALMSLLIYVVCVALRLARFNVQAAGAEKRNFTGLPSPMGAGVMFSPVMLFSEFGIDPGVNMMWFYLIMAPFVGLIMVSNIPYKKFPAAMMKGQFNLLVIAAIVISAIISNPGIVVSGIVYLYFGFGIASYIVNHVFKVKKKDTSRILKDKPSKEDNFLMP